MKRKLSVGWILLLVICCLISGATGDTTYTPTTNNGEVVPGSLTNYTHNHNYIPGRVTKEPTCTQTGTQEYNCNCGVSETRTLPAGDEGSHLRPDGNPDPEVLGLRPDGNGNHRQNQ